MNDSSRTIKLPRRVESGYLGYAWLNYFAKVLLNERKSPIFLDFSTNDFFEANLCAVMGALISQREKRLGARDVLLFNEKVDVEKALAKNGFAPAYGGLFEDDFFDTTIKFRQFKLGNTKDFTQYIQLELINKDLPLVDSTRKNFQTALSEVFNNAKRHSQSSMGLFSCGQHFPAKEYINYTLVDLGVGFQATVAAKVEREITAVSAIKWAVREGHSGRTDQSFGGIGLSDIAQTIEENSGVFQIISGNAFWELTGHDDSKETIIARELADPFPGSIINLQINTALEKYHQLEVGEAKGKAAKILEQQLRAAKIVDLDGSVF